MNLLIIGGTRFVGRHLVEVALARGHTITLFNRGQSNPDLFLQVEQLHGDRGADLSPLKDRSWDAVIDTCGYVPRIVRLSAQALVGHTDRYVFISTVSVYAEDNPRGMDENSPLATLKDESVEDVTGENYGGLKVLCEKAVEQAYPDRALIIRPGLIVGPHDPTDRFTYWPWRIAQGGEVLAPGNPDQLQQIIDVRDLAQWIVQMVEAKRTGIFNAVGPDYTLTTRRMLEACVTVCNPQAQLTWLSESFLLEHKVEPWSEMPVWVPEKESAMDTCSNAHAISAGLKFRSIEETIRDTLAWAKTRPADHVWRAGMKPEREAELLREWK
ncbi:MAG TPA: SDR family oxidoreductase [Anaerolineae bacterium]|nr:SDR family oxidoreductase [Anaerolineae bacterium]